MKLRKELLPTERTDEFKKMIKSRIEFIEQKLDKNEDITQEVIEFNSITGRDYDLSFFQDYWTFMSIDEFVTEACSPIPQKVFDITKEELIELVRRAKDYETYKEDTNFYVQVLKANTIMPDISDLLCYNKEKLTPEQLVEKALNYKPIIL